MKSAPKAVQTNSHGEAETWIATAPPTARNTKPVAIAKTSTMTSRLIPYEYPIISATYASTTSVNAGRIATEAIKPIANRITATRFA